MATEYPKKASVDPGRDVCWPNVGPAALASVLATVIASNAKIEAPSVFGTSVFATTMNRPSDAECNVRTWAGRGPPATAIWRFWSPSAGGAPAESIHFRKTPYDYRRVSTRHRRLGLPRTTPSENRMAFPETGRRRYSSRHPAATKDSVAQGQNATGPLFALEERAIAASARDPICGDPNESHVSK